MNKKLKLKEIEVQSFVTSIDSMTDVVGGARTLNNQDCIRPTLYSCLDYLTCDVVRCAGESNYAVCPEKTELVCIE